MATVYRARDVLAELFQAELLADCHWCYRSFPVHPHGHDPYCSETCRRIAEQNGGNNTDGALL